MKYKFLILLTLSSLSYCKLNWWGDINLGSNFYYLVEPAFNSIVIPVNPKDPYKSSIYIIKDIESLGFNKNYILVSSKKGNELKYWLIDKKTESKELGYGKNSIMKLSNVLEIKLSEFQKIRANEKIKLKTKSEYRKELNYE